MNKLAPLMASERPDWNTPQVIVSMVFRFFDGDPDLDPCSNASSIVGAKMMWRLEDGQDGLARSWEDHGTVYVNPPYGREIWGWIKKCFNEWVRGNVEQVIALVPARVDTRWFAECWETARAICFWRGRLTFLGAPAPAPFPSALVYWGANQDRFREVFGPRGHVVQP